MAAVASLYMPLKRRMMNHKRLAATLLSLALALALPTQSFAQTQAAPDESQLTEHDHYKNKNGQSVHSPAHSAYGKIPVGATARCRDGSYSFSQHRSGTCSGHHGVAEWE